MAKDDRSNKESLFRNLTRLFRSGPLVRRKVKLASKLDGHAMQSSAMDLFAKSQSHVYSNAINQYGQYDRMCIALSTSIPIPGAERFKTLGQLIEEYPNGEKFLVYAYDHEKKCIVTAWAHHPRSSGFRETVKIVFNDASSLVCTPDHPCMMRDGTYRDAGDLKPNDRMMPFSYGYGANDRQAVVKSVMGADLKNETKTEVGDLTVDGYENFATSCICCHNSRYADFSEMEYCLSYSTLIALPDGWHAIGDLAKQCDADPDYKFVVYSYDHEKKQIVPAYAKQARQTRTDHAWKVTFDNGKEIIGTANHRLMLRDGTYRTIEDLRPGDAMMPFERKQPVYKKKRDGRADLGYPIVYTMGGGRNSHVNWQLEHRVIAEWIAGRPIAEDEVVHHINFKKNDNRPENLRIMKKVDHDSYHMNIVNNDVKWTEENRVWIDEFKRNHSKWMAQYAPTRRNDVTFGMILETSEACGFNSREVCRVLDIDLTLIRSRLMLNGFKNYSSFAAAYSRGAGCDSLENQYVIGINDLTLDHIGGVLLESDTKASLCLKLGCTINVFNKFLAHKVGTSWFELRSARGWSPGAHQKGGRPKCANNKQLTYKQVCDAYTVGTTLPYLAKKLGVNKNTVLSRISQQGFKRYGDWTKSYKNCKVVSIEYHGEIPLYDLTVDGYKNFATDSVISHNTPEISSALNIYSDEVVAQDDKGQTLHIFSDDQQILKLLSELFYDTLNIEFNLRPWVRNLVKYGDMFIFNDLSPEHGIINAFPIPVNEIEREEGYDPDDPLAVRYRWVTQRNSILENWQVTHMRLLGNDAFLPYGSSIIEPARRIWRQLILIEDAMLVYRVVRSPERRIFYIDVGTIPPEDVPAYMEKAKVALRSNDIVDKSQGRVDLRHNPQCNSLKTLIKLQDGRTLALGDVIREWDSGKQDQWVYSIDVDGKRVVPGKVTWAGITRRDAELLRVTLDDGSHIDATPDHRFMLRDATYARADELVVGQSLMPLYITYTSKATGENTVGYEKTYDPFKNQYVTTHRNNVLITQGSGVLAGNIVHHVDFDKFNNNPENLAPMRLSEHKKLHGDEIVKYNKSDIGRRNSRNRMKKTWAEGKITQQTFIDLWKDDVIRSKRVEALTLDVGDQFVQHCMRVLDGLGTGLSTRERTFIDALNSDEEFVTYMRDLNPGFKNGFNDRVTRSSLQNHLKSLGYARALESLKRAWLLSRYDIEDVKRFCVTGYRRRADVLQEFGLNRINFEELVRLTGHDLNEFRHEFMHRNAQPGSQKPLLNHKVMSVERLVELEDTGCITVDVYQNFAAGGTLPNDVGFDDCNGNDVDSMRNSNSFVYLHNSVIDDYWIPVRGTEQGTKIDTLPGGTHVSAVEDVEYIQKKLFAALQVPRAYLGYDESLGSKSTLAQEDIRFSRTINMIQRIVIAELNKIAAIHLYANGFDGEKLLDFALRLSNPSTLASQQKLEIYRSKFEIAAAGAGVEGLVDKYFLRKNILGMTDDEVRLVEAGIARDKKFDAYVEQETGASAGGDGGMGGLGAPGGGGEEAGGAEALFAGDDMGDGSPALDEKDGDDEDLLTGSEEKFPQPDEQQKMPSQRGTPVKANQASSLTRALYNRSRQRTHGSSKTGIPDFNAMLRHDHPTSSDPFDARVVGIGNNPLKHPFAESDEGDEGESMSRVEAKFLKMDSQVQRLVRNVPRAGNPAGSSRLIRDTYEREGPTLTEALSISEEEGITDGEEEEQWIDIDVDEGTGGEE